ncbi:MAG TPA: hypothetical protein VHP32_03235 [Ignavibacteria bacterium]|nr:hypothetical protein [Ignavibacteria bacterium]
MKKIFVILFLLVFSYAQADDFSDAMVKAKLNFKNAVNKADEKELIKVRGQFERILQLKKDEWLVNYWIAFTDYNLALIHSQKEDKENIKKYTESAFTTLDKVIDKNPNFSDAYVLRLAATFNRWLYEQDKMMDIISASQQAEEMSKSADPNNPRYFLVKGISLYWTPAAFGGGEEKALEQFQKSEEYFKIRKEVNETYPDWGQDQLYGYYALALMKRDKEGDMAKAKEYIDMALAIDPESGFIKSFVEKQYNEKTGK